ncbi:response regulator [Actinomadura flavalba]|uniref:response regulator n=1 Tax=Actinomadura flavalba TaxID=1120938 RepID=UPI00035D56AA|nr:response regulator [Actinomadura flavalba]
MHPSPVRILAVDDRDENLVALSAVLDALPVEVVAVTSGQAALKELLGDDFALILLDVVMPGMDGFETAGHIKSRPKTRDVPIIFLTAAGDDGEEAYRGYAAGAADYLTKPFDPWLLRAKVSVFVELHRRNLELAHQASVLRRTTADDGAVRAIVDGPIARLEAEAARLREVSGVPSGALAGLDAELGDLRKALEALAARG